MTTFDSAPTSWRRRATGTLASTAMIAAGFLALAGPAHADGTTFYVNPGGSNEATCGTQVLQCKTIQAAVSQAEDGDTVLVAPGTYNGSVNITSAITVQSTGTRDDTIIDGKGLTLPNGLVNITQPGGNVTFSGFTVKNQTNNGGVNDDNDDSFAVTINDKVAGDVITVSNNVFPAQDSKDGSIPYGVNSANTAAKQVISDNEFSGLWRGILIEGTNGPVDINSNVFHDLISVPTGNEDGSTYPPKGVYFLADTNGDSQNQDVTGNTFRDYGGIGVSYRAGYDLGGCSGQTLCDGNITGSATDNTFDLKAAPATNVAALNQQPAAFNVQALYAGDNVKLTVGGNVGDAPAQPIIEVPGPGTTIIIPGAKPNTIAPTPAPTVALTLPSSIVAGAAAQEGSVSVTNQGATLSSVRYGVKITGTKGITAAQVKLQYDADPSPSVNYVDATLTGTANSGGAITGYFKPVDGASLPGSTNPVVTGLRLSIPNPATTPDTLTTTIQLDQVSTGTGNPVIDTLATSDAATTVVTAPPAAPVDTVKPTLGTVAKAGSPQTVSIKVTDTNGNAPAAGTEVDVLVSGATVANGTVVTDATGVATFTFTTQHKGAFTVKAIAGGKSGTIGGTTPIRNVSTSVGLASPAKGTIKAVAYTSPKASGAIIAFSFVQNGKIVFFHNAKADANGIATITATGRVSGGTYSMTARVVNDPDTDSVYAPTRSIKIR